MLLLRYHRLDDALWHNKFAWLPTRIKEPDRSVAWIWFESYLRRAHYSTYDKVWERQRYECSQRESFADNHD